MIDDSGSINETLPSLAFENSIHNPFLNHINSFRSIQVPNTVYFGISMHPFLIQMQTTQIWYSLVRFRTALPAVPPMSPIANSIPSTSSVRVPSSILPSTAKSLGNSLSSIQGFLTTEEIRRFHRPCFPPREIDLDVHRGFVA